MTYRTEFPDFDFEVPALISEANGWEDTSWKNDVCPSFTCDVFVLWIDYTDPERRQFRTGPQFSMHCEGSVYLATDSWEDVRAFIEDGKRDFPDYAYRDDSFVVGLHEEICSLRDGGPVVHVDGKFAVVKLNEDAFYLIYGDRESYANGARDEADEASEFETLDAAVAELALAKAAMDA